MKSAKREIKNHQFHVGEVHHKESHKHNFLRYSKGDQRRGGDGLRPRKRKEKKERRKPKMKARSF